METTFSKINYFDIWSPLSGHLIPHEEFGKQFQNSIKLLESVERMGSQKVIVIGDKYLTPKYGNHNS